MKASPFALRNFKSPRATFWAFFVPQERSAALPRDVLARKRCPKFPSERSPKDIRFPVMQKAPPILQNENGGALSHLEFGKALQTCRPALVNHHSMPRILSAPGKMIGTMQNACLSAHLQTSVGGYPKMVHSLNMKKVRSDTPLS